MGESLKRIQIFAVFPSDVASERAKLETIIKSLKPMEDYLWKLWFGALLYLMQGSNHSK